ncbi:TetR/AcrR family transcriptional regulator [Planomonospora sp. ID67723]|uniref:TetR/AcrR family transcriptional regulator n=1 Tax=Planomonospora sp. ID67723 TaxID=2738134 RepID=UPI0027DCA31D|nr:TetR/AcrR family transcriptional regulator [Planomonospora sp. ID67723]
MSGNGSGKEIDRRVRRTREAIRKALVALIVERGYDAVTVTDVIARADVGRSTFYAHFTDKRDVLAANLEELAGFLRASSAAGPDRLFAFSLPMFEHIDEQRDLVRALLGRRGGGAVVPYIEQVLATIVREELLSRLPAGAAPSDLDLVVACVVGAFMALLARHADGEISTTPRQLDAAFHAVVAPGVQAILHQR